MLLIFLHQYLPFNEFYPARNRYRKHYPISVSEGIWYCHPICSYSPFHSPLSVANMQTARLVPVAKTAQYQYGAVLSGGHESKGVGTSEIVTVIFPLAKESWRIWIVGQGLVLKGWWLNFHQNAVFILQWIAVYTVWILFLDSLPVIFA